MSFLVDRIHQDSFFLNSSFRYSDDSFSHPLLPECTLFGKEVSFFRDEISQKKAKYNSIELRLHFQCHSENGSSDNLCLSFRKWSWCVPPGGLFGVVSGLKGPSRASLGSFVHCGPFYRRLTKKCVLPSRPQSSGSFSKPGSGTPNDSFSHRCPSAPRRIDRASTCALSFRKWSWPPGGPFWGVVGGPERAEPRLIRIFSAHCGPNEEICPSWSTAVIRRVSFSMPDSGVSKDSSSHRCPSALHLEKKFLSVMRSNQKKAKYNSIELRPHVPCHVYYSNRKKKY
ncbi:hypothetical protein CEXT_313381 [Caerostris extrusa]|uniref:Uncharacterized protein n=1 Tax=Caerostris extrusa TaxID=172846 RepID=A0AAV4Y9R4_CAEEX|nr:hypothetical protein CEXT_313381 [Caerostris extrusa]